MSKKYYAYFIPKNGEFGITNRWAECEKKIKGISGARFKSFKTKQEAEEWLRQGASYVPLSLEPGVYFDAGTGRGQGVEISVTDENGANLLPRKIIIDSLILERNQFGKYQLPVDFTNNYGELLAFYLACKIALTKKIKKIFGDSRLVINYWSRGFVNEKNVSLETLKLIDKVFLIREKFENNGGVVIYIAGRDNPADLGFHK
jgi:ribonuclease HI